MTERGSTVAIAADVVLQHAAVQLSDRMGYFFLTAA